MRNKIRGSVTQVLGKNKAEIPSPGLTSAFPADQPTALHKLRVDAALRDVVSGHSRDRLAVRLDDLRGLSKL